MQFPPGPQGLNWAPPYEEPAVKDVSRIYFEWMWFWCWACYRAYTALPVASNHHTRYGRFLMWLLGYAGCYAYCERSNFHQCSFFEGAPLSRPDRGGSDV